MLNQLVVVLVFCCSIIGGYAQSLHDQYIDSAEHYSSNMKFYLAASFYESALNESRKTKDSLQIAHDLIGLANNKRKLGSVQEALDDFFTALKIAESKKPGDTIVFSALQSIGTTFLNMNDLVSARKYLNRAYSLAKVKGDPNLISFSLSQYGKIERISKKYSESIRHYENALNILPDSAKSQKFIVLIGLSTTYGYSEDYNKALECLDKALKVNDELGSNYNNTILFGQIGRVHLLKGNTKLAIDYYLKGLEVSKQEKFPEFIERFTRELARAYHKVGDDKKAYYYYSEFVNLYTENQDKLNADLIYEMSAKYELDKKEEEIHYLEAQRKLERQIYQGKLNRRNQIILFSSILGLFILITAIWASRIQKNKRKVALKLSDKEKEVRKQQAILEGQELERNRLSRELHDGIGGTLAGIKMKLSNQTFDEQERILKELDDACNEVRNVSHNLNTVYIENANFQDLLTHFADNFRRNTGIYVQFDFFPPEILNELSNELKHHCYRIFQELTANIKKHAQASNATIGLVVDDKDVILLVEDNGKGFGENDISQGIGLVNVKERVKRMNGEFERHSKIGAGTSISIRFPFQNNRYENETFIG